MIESARARQAWADYLALGDGRSLEALANRYHSAIKPPSRRLKTLADWSRAFDWQGRLKKLADEVVTAAEEAFQARRREIMGSGPALDFERAQILKELLGRQLDDFREPVPFTEVRDGKEVEAGTPDKVWVPDVKLAADGTQVPIRRYNDEQLRQIRGLLDDLAKETGGRQSKVDVTSGGLPIKGYVGVDPDRV